MLKTIIKVKTISGTKPEIIEKGDWIDLRVLQDYSIKKYEYKLLDLNVCIKLPKGFEAIIASRSSTPKNYKIQCANSLGIIDECYCGDNDIWKFPALAFSNTFITKNDRICQFRIQPSQKASIWVKLKWLFSTGVKLVHVDKLSEKDRGGIGHTGKN